MGTETATVDRAAFLMAMRGVASSVAVVTTDGPAGRHGATVSSFCSVSADPPTLLVCLRAGSRTAALVGKNGVFSINVLPRTAEAIARRFAGANDTEVADRFDGIEIKDGTPPGIAGATVLECGVGQAMHSGSHQVFIGKVRAIHGGGQRPLTYFNGAYHEVQPLAEGDLGEDGDHRRPGNK